MAELCLTGLQPNSPELVRRLRNVDWLGREFSYAQYIRSIKMAEAPEPPAMSLILCLDRLEKKVVAALHMLLDANPDSLEIIIVNPQCSSPWLAVLPRIAHVWIDVDDNCPEYTSRNMGALFANAPMLLFLSDAVAPVPALPQAYINCLSREGVIAARGRVLKERQSYTALFRRFDLGDCSFPWALDLDENMAILAQQFFSIGGFDETLQPGFGALDLSAKIYQRFPEYQAQQYCPEAAAFSHAGSTPLHHGMDSQISWKQLTEKYAPKKDENHLLLYYDYWFSLLKKFMKDKGAV